MDDTTIHPVRFTRRQVEFIKHIMVERTFEEWCDEIFDAINQAEKAEEKLELRRKSTKARIWGL